jgi:hypothetical protein
MYEFRSGTRGPSTDVPAAPLLAPPAPTSLLAHLARAVGTVAWEVLLWADQREHRRSTGDRRRGSDPSPGVS